MFRNEEEFIAELEDYLRNTKQLTDSSVKLYLNRIRRLLETEYSVGDLRGCTDLLWEEYGPNGSKYDPNDHANTRAAIRHVDGLVRKQLLERVGNFYISYEQGWNSVRRIDKHESGYTIKDGTITFSYCTGFSKSKDVTKRISTRNLDKLINVLFRAYRKHVLAASNTCIVTVHGKQFKYDYSLFDDAGTDCGCLFEGDSTYVAQLKKENEDIIDCLRS